MDGAGGTGNVGQGDLPQEPVGTRNVKHSRRKTTISKPRNLPSLPFREGGVLCLQVTLLTEPDLASSDLYSDQGEALLQRPRVHDGLDVQLVIREPLRHTHNIKLM